MSAPLNRSTTHGLSGYGKQAYTSPGSRRNSMSLSPCQAGMSGGKHPTTKPRGVYGSYGECARSGQKTYTRKKASLNT